MSKKNKYSADLDKKNTNQYIPVESPDFDLAPDDNGLPVIEYEMPSQPIVIPTEALPEPEQTLELHDAARRLVAGWHDRWLSGLQAYAKQMCIPSLSTEQAYKDLFSKFGLKLK
jgi:hypothetical protein